MSLKLSIAIKVFATVITVLMLFCSLPSTVLASASAEGKVLIAKIDPGKFNPKAVEALNGKVVYVAELAPIAVITVPGKAVGLVKNLPGVLHVSEDAVVNILAPSKKPEKPPGQDKGRKEQPPQTMPWGIDYIEADQAWASTTGFADSNDDSDSEIEVAIIDTGVDKDHPDLEGNIKWGIAVWRGKISSGYNDQNGHGTHVAGIIAALNNEIGVIGVAPTVELYIVKAFSASGTAYISDLIIAVDLAVKGPDGVIDFDGDGVVVGDSGDDAPEVISMSFGGSADVPEFHEVLASAYNLGIVLVAAAGNEGESTPSYPAAYAEVIAVGAIAEDDTVPDWSNRNPELAAPGVDILSTYPDGTYETLSGTSMACPHVSGTVALMQAARLANSSKLLLPGGENDSGTDTVTVRGILHTTAMDKGTSGYDSLYGYGVVNAYDAVLASLSG